MGWQAVSHLPALGTVEEWSEKTLPHGNKDKTKDIHMHEWPWCGACMASEATVNHKTVSHLQYPGRGRAASGLSPLLSQPWAVGTLCQACSGLWSCHGLSPALCCGGNHHWGPPLSLYSWEKFFGERWDRGEDRSWAADGLQRAAAALRVHGFRGKDISKGSRRDWVEFVAKQEDHKIFWAESKPW